MAAAALNCNTNGNDSSTFVNPSPEIRLHNFLEPVESSQTQSILITDPAVSANTTSYNNSNNQVFCNSATAVISSNNYTLINTDSINRNTNHNQNHNYNYNYSSADTNPSASVSYYSNENWWVNNNHNLRGGGELDQFGNDDLIVVNNSGGGTYVVQHPANAANPVSYTGNYGVSGAGTDHHAQALNIRCAWPPRFYPCSFCRRHFRSAQALGGHMNIHRRDRARLHQASSTANSTAPISTSTSAAPAAFSGNDNYDSTCRTHNTGVRLTSPSQSLPYLIPNPNHNVTNSNPNPNPTSNTMNMNAYSNLNNNIQISNSSPSKYNFRGNGNPALNGNPNFNHNPRARFSPIDSSCITNINTHGNPNSSPVRPDAITAIRNPNSCPVLMPDSITPIRNSHSGSNIDLQQAMNADGLNIHISTSPSDSGASPTLQHCRTSPRSPSPAAEITEQSLLQQSHGCSRTRFQQQVKAGDGASPKEKLHLHADFIINNNRISENDKIRTVINYMNNNPDQEYNINALSCHRHSHEAAGNFQFQQDDTTMSDQIYEDDNEAANSNDLLNRNSITKDQKRQQQHQELNYKIISTNHQQQKEHNQQNQKNQQQLVNNYHIVDLELRLGSS